MGIFDGEFLIKLPSFSEGLKDGLFSYELMILIALIFVMLSCVLLCFFGRKFFTTFFFIIAGMAGGYAGLVISRNMTDNKLMQLYFMMIFVFIGFFVFYAVSIILSSIAGFFKLRDSSGNFFVIFTSLAGALIGAVTIFFFIYSNIFISLIFALLTFIPGLIFQIKQGKNDRTFYSYKDLYELKPICSPEDEINA